MYIQCSWTEKTSQNLARYSAELHGHHSVNSSSHSVNGDIAIQ